jgi:hypothetical protein
MTDAALQYRGPATLGLGDRDIEIHVRLSARFEPVEGRYRWAGRTQSDDDLLARVRAGAREATLQIAGAAVPAKLGEPDAWGGVRLSGVGAAPWAGRSGCSLPGTGA